MKTIGFIGCGNMAKPIIRNTANKNVFEKEDIFVYDIDEEKLNDFCSEQGVNTAKSENEIALECDVVVLCTKPQVFPGLMEKIKDSLKKNKPLIISIAAGKTTEYIGSFLPFEAHITRIFPNLNAEVGEGVFSYTGNGFVSESEMEIVGKICTASGLGVNLSEDMFSALGVLGGCVPAYTFMFIDALAKAGEKNGIPTEYAKNIAIQTVLGSAALLKSGIGSADEMVKKVCSPGGTTIEGVNVLKNDGLYELVEKAFNASFEKDKKLL